MYKLVILDLDGTLLTSKEEISEYTCNIIKNIKDKTKIILASARGFWSIKPFLEQLDLLDKNNYTIAFNGSLIVNNLEQKIFDAEIGNNEKSVLNDCITKHQNIDWLFYTYDKRIKSVDIKDIKKFLTENKIYKVVCLADEITIGNLRKNLSQSVVNSFEITSSELTRIEFIKKGISKVNAIKRLLDDLKIEQSEVIAIGDGENDIEMIKFAGCGIAMKNAPLKVRKCADVITETNDNDGVGKILSKMFIPY